MEKKEYKKLVAVILPIHKEMFEKHLGEKFVDGIIEKYGIVYAISKKLTNPLK